MGLIWWRLVSSNLNFVPDIWCRFKQRKFRRQSNPKNNNASKEKSLTQKKNTLQLRRVKKSRVCGKDLWWETKNYKHKTTWKKHLRTRDLQWNQTEQRLVELSQQDWHETGRSDWNDQISFQSPKSLNPNNVTCLASWYCLCQTTRISNELNENK